MASPHPSGILIRPDIPICQTDLPLDSYQPEFQPYAEEYLALPDRMAASVLPWMDGYLERAIDEIGPELTLLAHYYMGGEIVKLVERYGGTVADSYQLAREAVLHPEKKIFVESAVHFMAEAIALLAAPDQQVYITNPRSGCTMEMMAKAFMVEPAFDALHERYGDDLMVVAYMNTSGRVKALAGRTGGAVCTSSNAGAIMRWARAQGRRVFFVPDEHLGRNVAAQVGIGEEVTYLLPAGHDGADVASLSESEQALLDRAELILWGSFCGVHTVFRPEHVTYWRERGYSVVVHPESPRETVAMADGAGSTRYLWNHVMQAPAGSRFAVGTEGHFVRNLKEQAVLRGIDVVHLADMPGNEAAGCGCATMSRNDPPHLVAMLDLLRQGKAPDINRVLAGDVVDEITGYRDRLDADARAETAQSARRALERMIEITEAAS
ncbi:MAG: quinolinate synthase NadA [Deltaproteobacteria bacterium]|nr:quinolinate synthase NadA [Deltaproteobacteria bacterium]MBW2415210.1 quinolinate synthase NadA [Deltaproteobacteria bacterium]